MSSIVVFRNVTFVNIPENGDAAVAALVAKELLVSVPQVGT